MWMGHTGDPKYRERVDLGDGMVAQHTGRGTYTFMHVQADLGGVLPPIGQEVSLKADGQIHIRDQMQNRYSGRG